MDKKYQSGFRNYFESEAVPGALPLGRNSPQRAPMGLYAEQLSGTAFTAPRVGNLRSWLYRVHPSVGHRDFVRMADLPWLTAPLAGETPPTQFRWDALPLPAAPTQFPFGVHTVCGNGAGAGMSGAGIHLYALSADMVDHFFYSADGELLFVPELNSLRLDTEFGEMLIAPGEIGVIPRGVKFQVTLPQGIARGYLLENYGKCFQIPDLGPIGSNGLANPRDFLAPCAKFQNRCAEFFLISKFGGAFWKAEVRNHPLDVVAWHGNYAPYKYDLRRFNTIGTVSFDHPDPSIFTVLTSPSDTPGTANVDFVIFPERWMIAEDTFRPPYYHRNVMSEYMGLIYGVYDAKPEGFVPGGGSLHNCMAAHGPDAQTFLAASEISLAPHKQKDTLAFMFESSQVWQLSHWALQSPLRQRSYGDCWQGLPRLFNGT